MLKCEEKSLHLQQELISKLSYEEYNKGGTRYICINCASRLGFHVNIIENIKNKYGDKSCEMC